MRGLTDEPVLKEQVMTTPEPTNQLIEEAKQLRQAIMLFQAAQRATLSYAGELIDDSYNTDEMETLDVSTEALDIAQQDLQFTHTVCLEIDALIAGHTTHEAFVRRLLKAMYPKTEDESIYLMAAEVCLEILRKSLWRGAEIIKERAESCLDSGLVLIHPAPFEEQVRKAIAHAKEVMALLAR